MSVYLSVWGSARPRRWQKWQAEQAREIPRLAGICVLDEPHKWEWALRRVPVTAVWGVAKRMATRLEALDIRSAWDLATANPKIVRRRSSVCLERTIEELNGRPCLELEEVTTCQEANLLYPQFREKGQKVTAGTGGRIPLCHPRGRKAPCAKTFCAYHAYLYPYITPLSLTSIQ